MTKERTLGTSLALSTVFLLPGVASATLVFGSSSVLDTSTLLSWQSLSASAGAPLPESGYLGSARVVSLNEILALFDIDTSQFLSSYSDPVVVPIDSDTYRLLEFFHSTQPSDAPCVGGSVGPGQSCFDGWWKEPLGAYNLVGFSYGPDASRPGFVDVVGTTTIGSYSQAQIDIDPAIFCKPDCNAYGLFTVVPVPLPGSVLMLATALLSICKRWRH